MRSREQRSTIMHPGCASRKYVAVSDVKCACDRHMSPGSVDWFEIFAMISGSETERDKHEYHGPSVFVALHSNSGVPPSITRI